MAQPQCVVVISGKRKSGKDYVANLLQQSLGKDLCTILRLSAPLKLQYAKENDLDIDKLMDASSYKEKYRADMIKWGEDKRNQDPGYFCCLATSGDNTHVPVWLISDARRLTDLKYFKEKYQEKVLAVRVTSPEAVRISRGWIFTTGVDDAESECGLDAVAEWDLIIDNGDDAEMLRQSLDQLISTVKRSIH